MTEHRDPTDIRLGEVFARAELDPIDIHIDAAPVTMHVQVADSGNGQIQAYSPSVAIESVAEHRVLELKRRLDELVWSIFRLAWSHEKSDQDSESTIVKNAELDAVVRLAITSYWQSRDRS